METCHRSSHQSPYQPHVHGTNSHSGVRNLTITTGNGGKKAFVTALTSAHNSLQGFFTPLISSIHEVLTCTGTLITAEQLGDRINPLANVSIYVRPDVKLS